ncbi:MAG: hypothetical protein U0903_12725 [Planctomycetales bacterium]
MVKFAEWVEFDVVREERKRKAMRPNIACFLAGSFLPFVCGVLWLAHEMAYRQEILKRLPNTYFCGTGTLGAWALIVVIAPVCGAVGWGAGWAFSQVFAWHSRK